MNTGLHDHQTYFAAHSPSSLLSRSRFSHIFLYMPVSLMGGDVGFSAEVGFLSDVCGFHPRFHMRSSNRFCSKVFSPSAPTPRSSNSINCDSSNTTDFSHSASTDTLTEADCSYTDASLLRRSSIFSSSACSVFSSSQSHASTSRSRDCLVATSSAQIRSGLFSCFSKGIIPAEPPFSSLLTEAYAAITCQFFSASSRASSSVGVAVGDGLVAFF